MRKSYEFEGIVSLLVGILLIFLPTTIILNILQFIIGAYLVFAFLPATILAFGMQKGGSFIGIKSLIMVVLGIVIMFMGFDYIASIIGVILLIGLLIDLFKSENKLDTFKKDLVKYIIALILIFLGINIVIQIGIRVIGIILIIIGIIALIANGKSKPKAPNSMNNNNQQTLNEDVIDVEFTEE